MNEARTFDLTAGKAAGFYEELRQDMMSGRLVPGERLSEALLSRQYGVSRSPVREAMARLEHDGLIECQGLVARVRERTSQEILDIYQARVHLEGAIAADAAERRQEDDLRRLDVIVAAARRVPTSDPVALVTANRAFHDALALSAHNATLRDLQDRLTAQIAMLPATTMSAPGRWKQARTEHQDIVDAVRHRDSSSARDLAAQHMTTARDIRLRLYDKGIQH